MSVQKQEVHAIYLVYFFFFLLYFSEGGDIFESEPGLTYQQLASEVKQLTKERDHLLAQARKDSETLEKREMAVKVQFEEQLRESHKRILQVRHS